MLRRFENFKVGALDAKRLNEMQDAIIDLQRKVERTPRFDMARYGPFLVQVTQRVDISRSECVPASPRATRIDAAVYYFREVMVRVDGTGGQPSSIDVCVSVRHDDGMMRSAGQGSDDVGLVPILLDLGADEYRYDVGDVVPCFRARIDFDQQGGGMSKWREVFVSTSGGSDPIGLYEIIGVGARRGEYQCLRSPSALFEGSRTIINLYETGNYYGALAASAPCASLSPRTLAIGDIVFGFPYRGELYTMSPTAFDVTCVDCGTLPASLPATFNAADLESRAASIMLKE